MTQHNSTTRVNKSSLIMRVVVGAGIGLVLIALFLSGADNAKAEWGDYWMVRPFIIVPLAGAMGGLCNYLLIHYRHLIGMNKAVAVILSFVFFIIGLWLGTVLGLDGTYWD